jgi:outer membrane protein TolC
VVNLRWLVLFLGLVAAQADSTHQVSWPQVVEAAIHNHLELQLAALEEALAQERLEIAQHGFLPSLALGSGFFRLDGRQQGSFGELRQTTFERYDPQLGVALSLNVGDRLHQVRARWHEYLASQYRTADARQKVLLGISQLYQSLLLSFRVREIVAQLVEARRATAELIESRVEAGVALRSDLAQARAALAEVESQKVTADNAWRQASIRLAQVLRWETQVPLVPEEDSWSLPQLFELKEDISGRLDLKRLEQNLSSLKEQLASAWWQLFGPNLEVEWRHGGLGRQIGELAAQDQIRLFLGWRLSLDKWDQIKLRERELALAKTQLAQAIDAAYAEIAAAKSDLAAAKDRLQLAEMRLKSGEEYLALAQERYLAGKTLLLEVLTAQDLAFRARIELLTVLSDYQLAQVRYLAALGALEPERLLGGGKGP